MPSSPLALRLFFQLLIVFASLQLFVGCSKSDNLEKDKRSAQSHLSNSERYLNQGQYRPAMLEVRNAIEKSPSAITIGALAKIYTELGQLRAAQSLLEKYAADFPDLNLALSNTYVSLAKYYSAQEVFSLIERSQSNSLEYDLLSAKIHLGLGKTNEAIKSLQQLRAAHPNSSQVRMAHYTAIFNTGTPNQSETALESLIQDFPENTEILYTAAKVRFIQNDYSATENYLMQALHLSPATDVPTPLRNGILNLISKTLTQQGRFADAIPFQKLLKESSPDIEDLQTRLAEAIAVVQAGDIQAGEALLEKLQQDFPNFERTDALLGVLSLEKGNPEKASNLFEGSVDPETASPQLSAAAAIAELRLDRKKEALSILEKALKGNPESLQLQSLYGLTAIAHPEYAKPGALALEKAIQLGSADFNSYLLLARYYSESEQADSALRILKLAAGTFSEANQQLTLYANFVRYGFEKDANNYAENLRSEQTSNEAGWLMAALADIKDNKPENISKNLAKAVSINPNSEKSWQLIGKNEFTLKHWDLSAKAFKKAIALNSNSQTYLVGLLNAELKNGKSFEQIATEFQSLAQDNAHKVRINRFLSAYAIQSGSFDNARNFINEIKASPESTAEQIEGLDIQLSLAIAAASAADNRISDAIDELEKTRKFYPESTQIIATLGSYYLKQGSLEQAETLHNNLTKLESPVFASLLGADILITKDQRQAAYDKLSRDWEEFKHPKIASAKFKLGSTLKITPTNTFLNEWKEFAPKDFQPSLILALNAQKNGDDSALALYEHVIRINPNQITALNNLAWLYQENNKLEKANLLASRAAKLAPTNPAILDTAGYIKLRLGDENALAILQQAHSLAPDNPEILEHYNQAKSKF